MKQKIEAFTNLVTYGRCCRVNGRAAASQVLLAFGVSLRWYFHLHTAGRRHVHTQGRSHTSPCTCCLSPNSATKNIQFVLRSSAPVAERHSLFIQIHCMKQNLPSSNLPITAVCPERNPNPDERSSLDHTEPSGSSSGFIQQQPLYPQTNAMTLKAHPIPNQWAQNLRNIPKQPATLERTRI